MAKDNTLIKYPSKLAFPILALAAFVYYAVTVDYNYPEAKSDAVKMGVMLLFMLSLPHLFGLKPFWRFLSKRVAFISKMDFADFVKLIGNSLALLLVLFFAITGLIVPSWLQITFNWLKVNVEAFVAFAVVVRLLQYDGD